MTEKSGVTFQDLSLAKPVLKTLAEVGYEIPTPIQERTIPLMLAGRDVLGHRGASFARPGWQARSVSRGGRSGHRMAGRSSRRRG